MSRTREDERSPLLRREHSSSDEHQQEEPERIDFSEGDEENPRNWTKRRKLINLFVIAIMALLSPLASSMFTPGISQIADDLNSSQEEIVGALTGFIIMLGVGPLILAPLSETFGRRILYLVCYFMFALLQIPAALAPNVGLLIAARTLSGFFGSVGVANGGGSISDMFHPSERAQKFGIYLLCVLLGPTLGPLFGGIIVQYLNWRWVFWILSIVSFGNTILGFFFLKESYAPIILAGKCKRLSKEHNGKPFTFPDADERPLSAKLKSAIVRPVKILVTQPIVITMSLYQALIFATMYSLFTNMEEIFGEKPYNFSTVQIGLLYLFPGLGFLISVIFIIPHIDTIYNKLTKVNDGVEKPEYRLPLANIGAILLPASLFWFAWTVEYRTHWLATISSTIFFGVGQVILFNTTQNYYVDFYARFAASAIAAGAVTRSVIGGIIPRFAPALFNAVGYGWGWSVFAFIAVLLAPSPILFMRYGEKIREKFAIKL